MKHLSDEKISQIYEASSKFIEAVSRMNSWDADLQSEADYEEAYALYQHWLGKLNWIYSGVLMDTPEHEATK